jgi:biopolymer transport protein ExbD
MKVIRARRAPVGIDMSPLIDCVFLLLIFFMLSSSFLTPSMRIRLPAASASSNRDPAQILVSVDEQGKLFVNSTPVAFEGLKRELERLLAESTTKVVTFRGDESSDYGLFVKVLDLARSAGALHVNVAHRLPKNP